MHSFVWFSSWCSIPWSSQRCSSHVWFVSFAPGEVRWELVSSLARSHWSAIWPIFFLFLHLFLLGALGLLISGLVILPPGHLLVSFLFLLVFCHHFSYWFSSFMGLIWVWLLVIRSPWCRRDDVVGDVYALWGCWPAVVLSALERFGSAPGLHRLCVPSMGMLWPAVFGA